jgi:hypothetical protein
MGIRTAVFRSVLIAVCATFSVLAADQQPKQTVNLSKDAVIECAKAEIAECHYRLAQMVEQGIEVEKNVQTAKQLYEMAYSNGFEGAAKDVLRLAKTTSEVNTTPYKQFKPKNNPPDVTGATAVKSSIPSNSQPIQFNVSQSLDAPTAPPAMRSPVPTIGGFSLDQSEAAFLSLVAEGNCQNRSQFPSALRVCTGKFRLIGGEPLEAVGLFAGDKLVDLEVTTPDLIQCSILRQDILQRNGSPMRGVTAWTFRKMSEGAMEMWGKRNKWLVFSICGDSEATTQLMARSSPNWQ